MKLSIKTLNGEVFSIDVDVTEKVSEIKRKIENTKASLIADKQKLIHAGKVLKDEQVIQELGLKDSDFVVCMITKEVSKKTEVPPPLVQTQATNPPNIEHSAPTSISSSTDTNRPAVPPQPVQSLFSKESLQSLVSMGFPENECKAALTASNGNPDLAYEFLLTGIPETNIPRGNEPIRVGGIDRLRQHPQLNSLKRLVQQNPAALSQVLDSIGQQDPSLLAAIHENNEAFIALMNEPIVESNPQAVSSGRDSSELGESAAIFQMIAGLPQNQRAQFAQSIGMNPEQLEGFISMMSSLPAGDAQELVNGTGSVDPPGVVRLTEEEMAAVNRLVALGFSQQQAAQAYLACDKNEALAANLLFEGGWGEDEGGDGPNDMFY